MITAVSIFLWVGFFICIKTKISYLFGNLHCLKFVDMSLYIFCLRVVQKNYLDVYRFDSWGTSTIPKFEVGQQVDSFTIDPPCTILVYEVLIFGWEIRNQGYVYQVLADSLTSILQEKRLKNSWSYLQLICVHLWG
jgi:hypothetical protein